MESRLSPEPVPTNRLRRDSLVQRIEDRYRIFDYVLSKYTLHSGLRGRLRRPRTKLAVV